MDDEGGVGGDVEGTLEEQMNGLWVKEARAANRCSTEILLPRLLTASSVLVPAMGMMGMMRMIVTTVVMIRQLFCEQGRHCWCCCSRSFDHRLRKTKVKRETEGDETKGNS